MKTVVFQTEEETACGSSKDEIGGNVAVLPWQGAYIVKNGVTLLARGDQDGGGT